MTPYTPQDTFAGTINTYDTSDPVVGGGSGVSNNPIKALADRTQYLYNRLGKLGGRKIVNGNVTIDATYAGLLAVIEANSHVTLTLDAVNNLPQNALVNFVAAMGGKTCVSINTPDTIRFGNQPKSTIYLYDGEFIQLLVRKAETIGSITYPDMLELVSCSDGLFAVGTTQSAYSVLPGYLVRNGQQISRTDYPRLFEYVDTYLNDGEAKVSALLWTSDIKYRGCFGIIDANNMVLPDDRSMFDRYLDLGRTLDLDRLHDYAGGLENDVIKTHDIPVPRVGYAGINGGGNKVVGNASSPVTTDGSLTYTGGSETRPKNVGKIPLIKY